MHSIDSRAYLHWIRNVRRGVITRTDILMKLDSEEWRSVSTIAEDLKVTPETVRYHLINMRRERLVEKEPEGTGWRLGEFDQLPLTEFLKKKKHSRKKSKNK